MWWLRGLSGTVVRPKEISVYLPFEPLPPFTRLKNTVCRVLFGALALVVGTTPLLAAVPGPFTLSGNAYCNTSPPVAPAVKLTWGGASGATSYTVYRNGS